jgi:hypothetical protein
MGAMKYVPGDMRRKEMLYMGRFFENFSCKIKKDENRSSYDASHSRQSTFNPPLCASAEGILFSPVG